MKIYVIRHGETDSNLKNIVGGIKEDLNENGIKQAEKVREEIANLNIDLIICSPANRTKHTCNIINKNNIPVIFDERLIERDVGIYENKDWNNIDRKEFWNYFSTKYTGLETMKSVYKRIAECLDEVKEKYSDKTILLVTHGGTLRAIYWYFNGIPEDGNVGYNMHSNCEIKEYEW